MSTNLVKNMLAAHLGDHKLEPNVRFVLEDTISAQLYAVAEHDNKVYICYLTPEIRHHTNTHYTAELAFLAYEKESVEAAYDEMMIQFKIDCLPVEA